MSAGNKAAELKRVGAFTAIYCQEGRLMAANQTSFKPGHLASVKHGAHSQQLRQRVREEDEARIRGQLLERWAHLGDCGFMVDLLVDALADVVYLRRVVQSNGGPASPRGHLYKVQELKRAREHDVFSYAGALMLPPREVARLGRAAGLGDPRQVQAAQAQSRLRARVLEDSGEAAS